MGSEAEAEQVHEGEDVISEAGSIGVVLFDPQVRLVVEKPIEHVGRIAHADVDHLGAERSVLVGDPRAVQSGESESRVRRRSRDAH